MPAYKFALKSSMSDRANLQEQAKSDGREDAEAVWPDVITDKAALKEHAILEAKNWKWQAEDVLEDTERAFTDDEEEFLSEYIDCYISGYNQAALAAKGE